MTITLNDILWSTRGFEWDFRILRHPPENRDWLLVYDEFFKGTEYEDQLFTIRETAARSPQKEQCVVLRFPDPQDRKDRSGRLIPHEFVIFSKSAEGLESWEQAREAIWPLVEDEYAGLYETNPFRASGAGKTDEATAIEPNEKAPSPPDSSSHLKTISIVGLFIILSYLLYAFYPDGAISVWGKVTFSDGTPLHGGTIVWTMEGTSRTTDVDKEGNYRLDLMKPGKYAVSFTGEATTLIDPKYLEADTSGLRITLDKANPFVGNKEQNVDFSVEQIIIPGEDTP